MKKNDDNIFIYKNMLIKIEKYEKNEINLHNLIFELEILNIKLSSSDPEWYPEFHEKWFALEEIHAFSLDRNIPHLEKKDIEEIVNFLGDLKTMILSRLEY